jgi:hypothetical protein
LAKLIGDIGTGQVEESAATPSQVKAEGGKGRRFGSIQVPYTGAAIRDRPGGSFSPLEEELSGVFIAPE